MGQAFFSHSMCFLFRDYISPPSVDLTLSYHRHMYITNTDYPNPDEDNRSPLSDTTPGTST